MSPASIDPSGKTKASPTRGEEVGEMPVHNNHEYEFSKDCD